MITIGLEISKGCLDGWWEQKSRMRMMDIGMGVTGIGNHVEGIIYLKEGTRFPFHKNKFC